MPANIYETTIQKQYAKLNKKNHGFQARSFKKA